MDSEPSLYAVARSSACSFSYDSPSCSALSTRTTPMDSEPPTGLSTEGKPTASAAAPSCPGAVMSMCAGVGTPAAASAWRVRSLLRAHATASTLLAG